MIEETLYGLTKRGRRHRKIGQGMVISLRQHEVYLILPSGDNLVLDNVCLKVVYENLCAHDKHLIT